MYGRKPILIYGISLFLLGSALCALAWSMYMLIFFRGVQPLGAGAVLATVSTVAGDLFSVCERAIIEGWLCSVWGVAAIAGPALGGELPAYLSWHLSFLITLAL